MDTAHKTRNVNLRIWGVYCIPTKQVVYVNENISVCKCFVGQIAPCVRPLFDIVRFDSVNF